MRAVTDHPTVTDDRKPKILSTRTAAPSNLFEIEVVHVRFSDGYEAAYESESYGKF